MKIAIDKNIPMPEHATVGRRCKYPWYEMEVGDSFLYDPPAIGGGLSSPKSLRDKGWKFTSAREGNTRRIWRVK